MSENQTAPLPNYGYGNDVVTQSPYNFGLNAGNTFLKKFEWIANGGKDGAEQEALDIVFDIAGAERNYRMFPVTKAFDANNNEIVDPASKEMAEAFSDMNARITHILHAFIDSEAIKAGFAVPIEGFKHFCELAMAMLPKEYPTIALDIFMQYQWQPSTGQTRTFLEIPRKMKYGRWLVKAIPAATEAGWKEMRVENPTDATRKAIWYVDEAGNEHEFTKNGWFMKSAFANPVGGNAAANTGQASGYGAGPAAGGATPPAANTAGPATPPSAAKQAAAW